MNIKLKYKVKNALTFVAFSPKAYYVTCFTIMLGLIIYAIHGGV